jgi:hypothetical protein
MFDIPRLLTTGLPELLHHHLGLRRDDAQATTRAIATEYAIRPRMDLEWRLPEPTRPVSFAALSGDALSARPMSMRHAEVRFARLRHSDVPGREVCGPVRLVGFNGAEVWTWTPKLPRYDWPHVATMLGGFGLLADGQRADFLDLAPWWSIVLPGKAAVALYALAEAHTLVVARDPEGFPRLRVTPADAFPSWEPRAQALDAFNRALDADVNDEAWRRTPSSSDRT